MQGNKEIWEEFSDLEVDEETRKIQKPRRLQRILRELSISEKEEDIHLIAKIASKYVSKNEGSDKEGSFLFHPLNKGGIYNALYMDSILATLYESNVKFKNEVLHELGNKHVEFVDYRIKTAPRLFSSEDVFDNFSEDVEKYTLSIQLKDAYGVRGKVIIKDEDRTWDKRWGKFLYDIGKYTCFPMLYNSDVETWTALLSSIKIPVLEGGGLTKRQFRQDCRWYGEVLQTAYRNNHPKKDFYYADFLEQGFPKDLLDKYVNEIK